MRQASHTLPRPAMWQLRLNCETTGCCTLTLLRPCNAPSAVMPFAKFRTDLAVQGGAAVRGVAAVNCGLAMARITCSLARFLTGVRGSFPPPPVACCRCCRSGCRLTRWRCCRRTRRSCSGKRMRCGSACSSLVPLGSASNSLKLLPPARISLPCRALQIADIQVHAVSYEQQQSAENQQIAGATPGSPAALYKHAE